MMPNPTILPKLKHALKAWPELELALLFGSHAQGKAQADSDMDIAVQMAQPLSADQKINMIETLACEFGCPVDIIDLRTAGVTLQAEIVATGVLIQGSRYQLGDFWYKNIVDLEDFGRYQQRILKDRLERWITS